MSILVGRKPPPDRSRLVSRSPARRLPVWETRSPKSQGLLASSDYPEGFAVELALDSGVPDHEAIAVLVQSALKEIGIEVTIVKLTPAVYAEQRASRSLRLFLDQNLWFVADPAYPLTSVISVRLF